MRPAEGAENAADGHDHVDASEGSRAHFKLGFCEENGCTADCSDGVTEEKPGAEEEDHVAEVARSDDGFS